MRFTSPLMLTRSAWQHTEVVALYEVEPQQESLGAHSLFPQQEFSVVLYVTPPQQESLAPRKSEVAQHVATLVEKP